MTNKPPWRIPALAVILLCSAAAQGEGNLIGNAGFRQRQGNGPAGFEPTGGAEYRYLGDPMRDTSGNGVSLRSDKPSGAVSCTVTGLDSGEGRWFRFSFRGLPQGNFAVEDNDLYLKIEFFGEHGKVSL